MSIISRLERLIEVPDYIKEDQTGFYDYEEFLAQLQPSTTSYFDMRVVKNRMDEWKWKAATPIIRRVVPGLIATELVGVQPMHNHLDISALMQDYTSRRFALDQLDQTYSDDMLSSVISKPRMLRATWDCDTIQIEHTKPVEQPVLRLTQHKFREFDPRHVTEGGDYVGMYFTQEEIANTIIKSWFKNNE